MLTKGLNRIEKSYLIIKWMVISIDNEHSDLGLEFTGNWFIDAGILGFVNLMEEVYGDLWIKEWKEGHPEDKDIDFLFVLQEKIKKLE